MWAVTLNILNVTRRNRTGFGQGNSLLVEMVNGQPLYTRLHSQSQLNVLRILTPVASMSHHLCRNLSSEEQQFLECDAV
jgi:hypothetical protein